MLVSSKKGVKMITSKQYVNFMNSRTQRIKNVMEDYNAGLMSISEAKQLLRDIDYEVRGFQLAYDMMKRGAA